MKTKKDWPHSQASREVKKKHTKNLKQKTLAAWCTQHMNQVHKSKIWLPDEKHHHRREDQRGDHELACSRSKNQRPVGGDRKLEQENQTRRTDLCGRKTKEKTCVHEAKRKPSTAHQELKETSFPFQPKI
jgi:hypothetical protein